MKSIRPIGHLLFLAALLAPSSSPAQPDAGNIAAPAPVAPGAVTAAPATTPAASDARPDDAPIQRFDVMEYVVEGNSKLPAIAIERAVYPFLGPQKTIDDVNGARTALEKAYQQQGFLTVYVDLPEQKVGDGVVRLKVVEGKVAKLRVTGSRYYSAGAIRDKVAELQPGAVPNFPQVQSELAPLSAGEGRRVTPVLRPGRTPGTVEADLKVEDKLPVRASLELNNRQSPSTERLRLQGSASYDNLWQRGHSIGMQFITAPESPGDLNVFVGTYVVPMSAPGSALVLYGVHSNSEVAAFGNLNVLGKGDILGLRYIAPLRSYKTYTHVLVLGGDYKNFKESGDLSTHIDYVPLAADYRATLIEGTRTHNSMIGVAVAVRGLFGNDSSEFADKRAGANASFAVAHLDWTTDQKLGDTRTLRMRVQGQLASGPLITNEQFSLGGAESVRGYLESEQTGDNGLVGSLEFRQDFKLPYGEKWVKTATALAFIEGGTVRVLEPQRQQASHYTLASTGVGLRLVGTHYWDAGVDVALALKDSPAPPPTPTAQAQGLVDTQYTQKNDVRVHFRVAAKF